MISNQFYDGDIRTGQGVVRPVTPVQRARAVRVVAAAAVDADECRDLLEALGLDAQEGVSSPEERAS